MREYKICRLSWTNGENNFAVLCRAPGSGWAYIAKYITEAAAEKLLQEVQA